MGRELTVLHIAETVRGGIATYFNELHALQTAEFGPGNVVYVVPAEHREDLTGVPAAAVVGFAGRGRGPVRLGAMALAALREVIRRRPDVVHLHSTFAGAVLRPLLALMPSRPAVLYCPHGWAFSREVSRPSRALTRVVERLLARLCDRVVCISGSEHGAARAAGVGGDRLALVRNGIAARRRRRRAGPARPDGGREDPRLRVLFVGRLDRQKGYDFLLAAARELPETVTVRMVGSKVVGQEALAGLPPNVEVLGWLPREAIEAEYDRADLVVMPSRWEGFGLVALEAMRAGLPVVAFPSGALGEIVVDGVTGLLCQPADARGLAAGLRRAASADLPGMGRRGARRFRALFAIERTHAGLVRAYHAALDRRRTGRRLPALAAFRK